MRRLRRGVAQVLKPGAKFASYEWLKTPLYDPNNPAHVRVVDGVAEGNALPDVRDLADVLAAAKEAGFEVVNCADAALTAQIPWHAAMKSARVGSYVTHVITAVLEFIGWAPAGTSAVHKMLMCARAHTHCRAPCLASRRFALWLRWLTIAVCAHTRSNAALDLEESGQLGVFTPMYLCVFQKPK